MYVCRVDRDADGRITEEEVREVGEPPFVEDWPVKFF